MYRAVKKHVGKLPSGALITKIFKYKGISIADDLKEAKLVNSEIGKGNSAQNEYEATVDGWIDLKNEGVKVGVADDEKC